MSILSLLLAAVLSGAAAAPDATALTLDGRAIAAEDLKDKVVLLSFASDSCLPCRDAQPMLRRLESRWSTKPFLLLTLGNDRQERELRRLISESGLPWQGVWTWRQEVVAKFGTGNYPMYLVIGPEGQSFPSVLGWSKENERRISDQISNGLRWLKKGKAKS